MRTNIRRGGTEHSCPLDSSLFGKTHGIRKVWLAVTAALLIGTGAVVGAIAQPDFTVTLEPDTVTLIPGKAAGFLVSVTPLNGFTQAVTLVAGSLPSGVTASFSRNPVTPPATSVLTLEATADAELGPFRLDLVGTSDSLTNSTSTSVTVNFGLLPVCYGAVKGVATDVETGLPLTNAQLTIYGGSWWWGVSVQADTNGSYSLTNLALSTDNLPQNYYVVGRSTGYWDSPSANFTAVCGAVLEAKVQLLKKQYATISGTVTDPDQNPLAGVRLQISGNDSQSSSSDTNGNFQISALQLAPNNQPGNYTVSGSAAGYWSASVWTNGFANGNTVVQLVMVPICDHIKVTGQVVYADTGLAATNASVSLWGSSQGGAATTDAQGNYQIDGLTLNYNNQPAQCTVTASAPGYNSTNTAVTLANCDSTSTIPLLSLPPLPPPPQYYFAGVTGHVYDLETSQSLSDVSITLWGMWTQTDDQGLFAFTNVNLGTVSSNYFWINASRDGWISGGSNLWLFSGQTATQDIQLLPRHYGYISGTVRDSASHAPIQDAVVEANNYPHTDQNGNYLIGAIQLWGANQPTSFGFNVTHAGYWTAYTNTTVTADQTNGVDIELIKVCTGANILGAVVNAVTQEPIAGARVSAGNRSSLTDTNGHFALTNLIVGNDNSPVQTTVYASAAGFIDQSKTVTIFCGANILTEFGRPQAVFGAIEGYVTNVLTGLPLADTFMGSEFGAAASTDTNGYYKFTQVPLGLNGADATWRVTAMPDGLAKQTKPILVSSNQTSRLDFGFGAPNTDLGVALNVSPNPAVIADEVTLVVTLDNNGGDARNVVLTDTLNQALTFVSASISGTTFDQPVFTNGTVRSSISNFLANASITLSIVVRPSISGTFTNRASVTSETEDTNPGNDFASVALGVSGGASTPGLQAGPLVFNRQTGLFEQGVTVTLGTGDVLQGVQVSITGVSAQQVYNACGVTNGIAFVQCVGPMSSAASVSFLLEYYLADRQTNGFNPQFALVPLTPVPAPPSVGQVLELDRNVQMAQGRLLIEFAATPGRKYAVQYSTDMETWQNAVPLIMAAGTRVQWYDDGPPKTLSKPSQVGTRFYRVLLVP